jgi:hypothetical protein
MTDLEHLTVAFRRMDGETGRMLISIARNMADSSPRPPSMRVITGGRSGPATSASKAAIRRVK